MQNEDTSLLCNNASQFVVRNLRKIFYQIGYCIGKFPWVFIILSLLSTAVIVPIGLRKFKRNESVKEMHTPGNARTYVENKIYKEFFSNRGDPFTAFISVTARDGGSMLRVEHMKAALNISRYIINNVTIQQDNTSLTFADLHHPYENINQPLVIFTELVEAYDRQLRTYGRVESRIDLNYPESSFIGQKVNMMPYLYGVVMKNQSMADDSSAIESVHMVFFHLRADMANRTRKDELVDWQRAVIDLWRQEFKTGIIEWFIMCDEYITASVADNEKAINPLFLVGFTLLLGFACASVLLSYTQSRNGIKGRCLPTQLLIPVAAVMSPVIAVATAMPLLFAVGYQFDAILSVTPFLTLAIGVDDAFLMIHSWLRTDNNVPVHERLGRVLSDIGPSITITSLTNCLAFGIGTISTTPIIDLFCTYTACCIAMDFLYQLTLFAAVLALVGRAEYKNESDKNCCLPRSTHPIAPALKPTTGPVVAQTIINKQLVPSSFITQAKLLLLKYCNFLCIKPVQIVVPIFLIIYWALSVMWTIQIPVSIRDEKLFLYDSPMQKLAHLRQHYTWKSYSPFHVFVNKPPDFTDPKQYYEFDSMVNEFCSVERSLGHNYTELWLEDYDKFLKFIECADGDDITLCSTFFDADFFTEIADETAIIEQSELTKTTEIGFPIDGPVQETVESKTGADLIISSEKAKRFNLDLLPSFLENPEYSDWETLILWSKTGPNSSIVLDKFYFTTAIANATLWDTRLKTMVTFRAIADKYSQFNVSIWEMESYFYDQMLSLRGVTLKTSAMTLACMALVCLFLIPAFPSVIVASVSTASITIGVCGLLHFFNIDLDPISMSSILMSIGLSVDYVAHISYHYFQAAFGVKSDRMEGVTLLGFSVNTVESHRLLAVLSSVGWPILQAAASTVLCVVPLLFVNGYMAFVFAMVVIIVVVLGLLHGLLLVPVVMTLMPDVQLSCTKLPALNSSRTKSNSKSSCSKSTSSDSGIEEGSATPSTGDSGSKSIGTTAVVTEQNIELNEQKATSL